MLCGHSGMIADSVALLEERGLKRHRRRDPGHISTEKYH
jgi:ferredoxin--NADP+ reductase